MLSRHWSLRPAVKWGNPAFEWAEEGDLITHRYIRANVSCPNCGVKVTKGVRAKLPKGSIMREFDISELSPADEHLEKLVENFNGLRGQKCAICESSLYQEVRPNGSYSLAMSFRRLFRKYRMHKHLIPLSAVFDEIHEDAAGDSNRGIAMGWVAEPFRYTMGLSATLTNGRPSSVFHLFHRLNPKFRGLWSLDQQNEFCRYYGNWVRIWDNKKERWRQHRELPGISPELIPPWLIDRVAYLSLEEAGFDMVPRWDIPVVVEPDWREDLALKQLSNHLRARISGQETSDKSISLGRKSGDLHLFRVQVNAWHHPTLAWFSPAWICPLCGRTKLDYGDLNLNKIETEETNWPPLTEGSPSPEWSFLREGHQMDPTLDREWVERQIYKGGCRHDWSFIEDQEDENYVAGGVKPVLDPTWVSTKERKLIEIIERERDRGRPVLVFLEHTGEYGVDDRLEAVFKRAGLRVLNVASINTKKLQERIAQAASTGTHVIIANVNRVGTAINLVETPTLIWGQPVYSVKVLVQASGRSRRPQQTKEVEVHYVVQGGAEMAVLSRAVEGMASAYLASGEDTDTFVDVLDVIGHVESLNEFLIRVVAGKVKTDLKDVFRALSTVRLEADQQLDEPKIILTTPQEETLAEPSVTITPVKEAIVGGDGGHFQNVQGTQMSFLDLFDISLPLPGEGKKKRVEKKDKVWTIDNMFE